MSWVESGVKQQVVITSLCLPRLMLLLCTSRGRVTGCHETQSGQLRTLVVSCGSRVSATDKNKADVKRGMNEGWPQATKQSGQFGMQRGPM